MRGPLEPGADHAAQSSREIDALVIESRFGRGDVALRQVESLLPVLEQRDDATMLLHALYARALIVRRLGASPEDALDACDTLEDAARTRSLHLWAAVACALRAESRVDEGDMVAATGDLARADVDLSPPELSSPVAFHLLDALAVVYARLRLYDRLDDVRQRIESTVDVRSPLERALHWAGWCSELAVRAMEPVAMGEGNPATESLQAAVEIGARIDTLPPAAVPPPLRRGISAVRALSAAYRGRPSEALRILGQDAFGEARQLPPVERQIATLAAMRAHAHVGSIASARSLDDAAGQTRSTLVHLVLSVCRARERLWLETHAGGQVVPVLNRLVDLLVRLGWHGMDLVADIARQSMEHHALREESRTDALTGVGNRRALDEELRQLVRFSQLPLSLVLVDVDDFKHVNDKFTHVVGDEVLRQVAASLSQQLRGGDRLLRFGGDEFVALLPATGDQEAHRVAARMARAIEALDWEALSNGLRVTVTTGCAALWSLTERRPDADAERLFQRADEALLSAKRRRAGRAGSRPAAAAPPPPAAQRFRPPTAAQPPAAAVPPWEASGHVRPAQTGPAAAAPAPAAPAPAAPGAAGALPLPLPAAELPPGGATTSRSAAPLPGGTSPAPRTPRHGLPADEAGLGWAEDAPRRAARLERSVGPDPVPGDRVDLPGSSRSAHSPAVPGGPVPGGPVPGGSVPGGLVPGGLVPGGLGSASGMPAVPVTPVAAGQTAASTPGVQDLPRVPAAALFNEPTSFVQPAPAMPAAGQPSPVTTPAPAVRPATSFPARDDDRPRAWEPGWEPEWARTARRRDPLTDPLTGPLMDPILDPLLDPRQERARRAAEQDLVDPQTDALELIDLTSGLTRRRRAGAPVDPYPYPTAMRPGSVTSHAGGLNGSSHTANGHAGHGHPGNGSAGNGSASNGAADGGHQGNGYAAHPAPGSSSPVNGRSLPGDPAGSGPSASVPRHQEPPPNGPVVLPFEPVNGQHPGHRQDGAGAPVVLPFEPVRGWPGADPRQASDDSGPGRADGPSVIDLTGHGLRRDRERLRGVADDEPR